VINVVVGIGYSVENVVGRGTNSSELSVIHRKSKYEQGDQKETRENCYWRLRDGQLC